uniref:Calcium uniporter protein n=1 Tax=Strongyloides stercoralis TaxID=6248 RepID=A0A0K0ECW5_STRER
MFSWFFSKPNENNVNEEMVKQIVNELEARKIEREIALKEAFLEREKAYNLAERRESFSWIFSSGLGVLFISIFSSIKSKNLSHLLPVIPTIGYIAYEGHYAYGNKGELILKSALKLLEDGKINGMSLDPVTIEEINQRKNDYKTHDI